MTRDHIPPMLTPQDTVGGVLELIDTMQQVAMADFPEKFENTTLERFLEAQTAWVRDAQSSGWDRRVGGRSVADETWESVAQCLRSGSDERSNGRQKDLRAYLTDVASRVSLAHMSEDELWLVSNVLIASSLYE